ncbi:MAG: uncharacterized protein JWP11_377 [Frankiales bacterium]|nr:uncharacterized protein [Frankiales bacterium]
MSAAPLELPLSVVPGLRLLPAPCSEPPYDDERPGGRPLPLRSTSLVARPLRIVPAFLDDEEPVRTPASDLPPAQPFAHALVQRLLEVVAGVRPLKQLQRDTTLEVYDELERVLTSRPRVAGPRPDGRAVRSVRVQQRPEGIAEVSATVRRGDRYAAVALRLEGVGGTWRCTQLVGA